MTGRQIFMIIQLALAISIVTSQVTNVSAVSAAPTATNVSGPPSAHEGEQVNVTAIVTDTGGSPSPPSGTVTWSDGGGGGSFHGIGMTSTCTLSRAGPDASACWIVYTPFRTGVITITAGYSGESTHDGSSGTASLAVNPESFSSSSVPEFPSNSTAVIVFVALAFAALALMRVSRKSSLTDDTGRGYHQD